MVELARSKLSFGLLVDESDEAAMTRLAELDRALKEMGAVREQIAAARRPKTKASVQDETLERLTERFNDPKKPTFVWQLDFAEVFHGGIQSCCGFVCQIRDRPDWRLRSRGGQSTVHPHPSAEGYRAGGCGVLRGSLRLCG